MNYGNYRVFKQMCHSMNLYERVHDNRLRNIVSTSEEQFGFVVKGKATTDAIVALRQLQERLALCVHLSGKIIRRSPHGRTVLVHARQEGARAEKYIRPVKDMHHQCETVCCRNNRNICHGRWLPPRTCLQPFPICHHDGLLTYFLCPSTGWEHGPSMKALHWILRCAMVTISRQVYPGPIFFTSDSMSRRHVFLGRPLFLLSWGFHVRASLVMQDWGFLRV